jgi:hypothetical protein
MPRSRLTTASLSFQDGPTQPCWVARHYNRAPPRTSRRASLFQPGPRPLALETIVDSATSTCTRRGNDESVSFVSAASRLHF